MGVTVPKFKVPFEIEGKHADYVEQDSTEEITQCVTTVLETHIGDRADIPTFGVEDQAFREGGADVQALSDAVRDWEPRADVTFDVDLESIVEETVDANVRRFDPHD
jgi:phage baseplate assembly protein W